MKIKSVVLKETLPLLVDKFGQDKANAIDEKARVELAKLRQDNQDEIKAVKQHTFDNIYPCISLYHAMQSEGISKKDAKDFLDWSYSYRAEKKAQQMRNMLKIPGAYKLMPRIFKMVTLSQFGSAAGFEAKFYDMGKKRCKFDMTKCLYCEVCKKNDCPELTVCFCHTDDVTDGNMHPKIKWNRTKIMGDGADVCDFDIIVED